MSREPKDLVIRELRKMARQLLKRHPLRRGAYMINDETLKRIADTRILGAV